MRKRILASIMCAALSASMMMGTAMVGAAENSVKTGSTKIFTSANQALKSESGKKQVVKSGNVIPKTMKRDATNPYKTITLNANGTIVFSYSLSGYGYCVIADANGYGVKMLGNTSKNTVYATNMKRGTYYVYGDGASVTSFSASLYSSENGSIAASKAKYIAGTGSYNYQTFYVSKKRAQVKITSVGQWYSGGNHGVTVLIQKRNSNGSYSTVSDSEYAGSSNSYTTGYALNKGSYRFALKGYTSGYMAVKWTQTGYTGSYGTKKSKSKTISRKKSKSNVLTASDKKKTSHWYKIKVTKKRSSRIDVYSYNSSGSVTATLYKGGKRLSYRTVSSPTNIYFKGKLSKGTYYVKVTKNTAKTSGMYKVKYTK